MSVKIKSTKSFVNLPCGHSQWFANGPNSECNVIHGYDRSVHFVFAGDIDEHGWIYPFGDLKKVKAFLEYYFDHVTVLGADDPRLAELDDKILQPGNLLGGLRILPSGVSMEMSSLFVWEHVNPYIYHTSGGRVFVERVEIKEHDRNSAFLEVDYDTAKAQAETYKPTSEFMPMKPVWEFEKPKDAMTRLNLR
jgi:6-pyruvoyltetrahydropterin/6-carboxytetrahydropterin synthase